MAPVGSATPVPAVSKATRRGRMIWICHRPGQIAEAISHAVRRDLARLLPGAVVTTGESTTSVAQTPAVTPAHGLSPPRMLAECCDVLIVVIDREWIPLQLSEPVHDAIGTALTRGIGIVPLLIDGAELPQPQHLPERVRGMLAYNAHTLRGGSEYAASLRSLAESLGSVWRPRSWLPLVIAGTCAALLVAGGVLAAIQVHRDGAPGAQQLPRAGTASNPPEQALPPVTSIKATAVSEVPSQSRAAPAVEVTRSSNEKAAQPRVDGACKQSCQQSGLCVEQGGVCAATTNAHCRASWICRVWGRCSVEAGDCRAKSQADCKASMGCARQGTCVLRDGECSVGSDSDCRGASICRTDGRCTAYFGECTATKATDCAAAETCTRDGNCVPSKGHCVPP